MDRKGVVFFLALLLILLLVFGYAFAALLGKQGKIERRIGESQIAALKAYQRGEQAKLYALSTARIAVDAAVLAMADGQGTPCERRFGLPLWRMVGDGGVTECRITKPQLKAQFDAVLNSIWAEYKNPIVEVGAVATAITDTAAGATVSLIPKSVVIPITCRGEQCGIYRFSAATTVETPYHFDEFLSVQERVLGSDGLVEQMENCLHDGEWQQCVEQTLQGVSDAQLQFSTDCGQEVAPAEGFGKVLLACAVTPQRFWHYDAHAGVVESPVQYRFAVEVG